MRDGRKELQKRYIKELTDCPIKQAIVTDPNHNNCSMPREEAYVELAVLEAKEVDKLWKCAERDFHIEQNRLSRSSINMNEIVMSCDETVIVRGIAGIGKTTMIENYVLQWAKSKILQGNSLEAHVDFLFKFSCREINAMSKFDSLEDLFHRNYSDIFKYITFEDLKEISDRVLIVLDGVDELKDIDLIEHIKADSNELQTVKLIFELIEAKTFLKGHKTILTGRPEVCQLVSSILCLSSNSNTAKRVEICGFNRENVDKYIIKFYGNDIARQKDIRMKLNESENLSMMATIPIYLWVICNIYKENIISTPIETTTELCMFSCLLFIRNHLRAKNLQNYKMATLRDLVEDDKILCILNTLARLSMSTLDERKVIFTEKDLRFVQMPIRIEESGFIVKFCYGDIKGTMYQFKHLVLQEFLAALYIYQQNEFVKYNKKTAFRNCIPLVAGLCGLAFKPKENLIRILLTNLKSTSYSMKNHKCLPLFSTVRTDPRAIVEYIEVEFMKMAIGDQLVINETCSHLLACLYEYRGALTSRFVNEVKRNKLKIQNLNFHHDIRNTIYFIEQLKLEVVSEVTIQNQSDEKLPSNLIEILKIALTDGYFERRLVLTVDQSMILYTRYADEYTKEIVVGFKNHSDIYKHKELILGLLHAVDRVVLSYQLDHYYPIIQRLIESLDIKVGYKNFDVVCPSLIQVQMFTDSIKMRQKSLSHLNLKQRSLTDRHIFLLCPTLFYFNTVDITHNYLTRTSLDLILGYILQSTRYNKFPTRRIQLSVSDFADQNAPQNIYIQSKQRPISSLVSNKEVSSSRRNRLPYYIKALGQSGYLANGRAASLYENNTPGQNKINLCIVLAEPEMEYQSLYHFISTLYDCFGDRHFKLLDLTQLSFQHLDHFNNLATFIPLFTIISLKGNWYVQPEHLAQIAKCIINKLNRSRIKILELSYCDFTDAHVKKLLPCLHLISQVFLKGNPAISDCAIITTLERVNQEFHKYNLKLKFMDLSLQNESTLTVMFGNCNIKVPAYSSVERFLISQHYSFYSSKNVWENAGKIHYS